MGEPFAAKAPVFQPPDAGGNGLSPPWIKPDEEIAVSLIACGARTLCVRWWGWARLGVAGMAAMITAPASKLRFIVFAMVVNSYCWFYGFTSLCDSSS